MIERLVANPYVTIDKIAKELSITYSMAQTHIEKLEAAGILKMGDRAYAATEIVKILET